MKKRELQTIYKNEFDYYGESDEEEQNANLIDPSEIQLIRGESDGEGGPSSSTAESIIAPLTVSDDGEGKFIVELIKIYIIRFRHQS
jgi:hypothetical protein